MLEKEPKDCPMYIENPNMIASMCDKCGGPEPYYDMHRGSGVCYGWNYIDTTIADYNKDCRAAIYVYASGATETRVWARQGFKEQSLQSNIVSGLDIPMALREVLSPIIEQHKDRLYWKTDSSFCADLYFAARKEQDHGPNEISKPFTLDMPNAGASPKFRYAPKWLSFSGGLIRDYVVFSICKYTGDLYLYSDEIRRSGYPFMTMLPVSLEDPTEENIDWVRAHEAELVSIPKLDFTEE